MAELQIRDMGPEDYSVYDRFEAALHRMHVNARPDLFQPIQHPVTAEQFLRMVQDSHEVLLLAEMAGKSAGICVLTLKEALENPPIVPHKSAHLGDLYIAEGFRKLGVGTALYREAQRRAKSFGAVDLSLMVWPFNSGALEFYQKLGMTVRSYTMETKL